MSDPLDLGHLPHGSRHRLRPGIMTDRAPMTSIPLFRAGSHLFSIREDGYDADVSSFEQVRRLVYASRAVGEDMRHDIQDILAVSRRNNGMDGVSGILWIDGGRYLQILEGPAESVGLAFARIAADPRHCDVEVIDDRDGVDRQFADWSMAGLPGDAPDDAKARLTRILARVDGDIARHFVRTTDQKG